MKAKRLLCLLFAVVLSLSSAVAFAEEEIFVISAPVATDGTDYSDLSNWAMWNEGADKPADLFFVCPTVDMGKSGNYNADIGNEKYRESFVGAINMELGIYNDVATVYAPYYRQATFPVYSLSAEEQETYLGLAYEDVKRAFLHYADRADASKPLILAGFSQGADLVIRLLKDLFDEPKYQNRLVAAYCIGWKLTEAEVREYPHLKPAGGETDTGVIIAFNSEDKAISESLIVGKEEKTYSINPLNWKTTSEKADKSLNLGACFADYSGAIEEEIPNLTGAYIDAKRGTLKVTDIAPKDYPGKLFEDGIYHLYDYQFFYRNLQENVAKRVSAFQKAEKERIKVYYNDELISFDVQPVIEKGRTSVPFRAIFETMGCAVSYSVDGGKQRVTARRGDDNLHLTIGEAKLYYNGKQIPLDVPAKIKNGRTLVPARAISEALENEVFWEGDTRSVIIYSAAEQFAVVPEKLTKTITDENGNVLIEAVAYYPVLKNPTEIPALDTINFDYKWEAERFLEEAQRAKEDALTLRRERGADGFTPFVFELTYEQTYNMGGYLSFTNHKYMNVGGAHPTTILESKTYCISEEHEYSLSEVIDEDRVGGSLVDYVTQLFVDELKEIDPVQYTYDYVKEALGYVQFYLTRNGVVLYFNQGEIAPYALGVIKAEIPYAPEEFLVDMRQNCLDEYVFEREYDKGYEWRVEAYAKEKLTVKEETVAYDPATLLSEYYPVGMKRVTLKGKAKGNAAMFLSYVKQGADSTEVEQVFLISTYVDENGKITVVSEGEVTEWFK